MINNPRSTCSPRAFSNTFNPCSPTRMNGKILVTWRKLLYFQICQKKKKKFNLQLDSYIIDWQTLLGGKLNTMKGVRKIRSVLIISVQLYFGYKCIECNSVYLLQNSDAEKAARFSLTFFRASKYCTSEKRYYN